LQQEHTFFEHNEGQQNSEVLYLNHGTGYTVFLTRTGLTIVLSAKQNDRRSAAESTSRYFRLRFGNANAQPQVIGIEQLPGISNYFGGSDPNLWHTRIPQFGKVRYSNLYPGIDAIFYFRDGRLEYDLLVSPGADPSAFYLQVENADSSLTRDGDVSIKIGASELLRLRKPHAYQGASRTMVAANYFLEHGKLSFTLHRYDRTQSLVVDPALIFATYLTSNCANCEDAVTDLAADGTGVYLTGLTSAASFPVTAGGPPATFSGTVNTFVLKLDPTGSHILYSTFLANSEGSAITVDSNHSPYVSGRASGAFPTTSGVFSGFSPTSTGAVGYAAKLSPDGSTLVYATLLQQPGTSTLDKPVVQALKVAVDSSGALYLTGNEVNDISKSPSSWAGVPTTVGAFQTTPGTVFVLKLNPTASGLDYGTYVDGVGQRGFLGAAGIAVDSAGNAFVAGSTINSTFVTTPGAYETVPPASNISGFVMELNPNGTAPVYSTVFGAPSSSTHVFGLALDSHGQAIITGWSSGLIPVTSNAFCGNYPGFADTISGFVAKLKADGSGLVFATTLCGPVASGNSVALDSSDAAYVVGNTGYPGTFQPILLHPIQSDVRDGSCTQNCQDSDNIAVKLDATGNLQWSTFLGAGGSPAGDPNGVITRNAADGAGDAYFLLNSDITPTPNSLGPPSITNQPSPAADLLLKIAPSLGAPAPIVSPSQVSFATENVGISSAATDVQVSNFGDAPLSVTVSINGDFSETDNCSTAVPGGQRCDINVIFTPTAGGARSGALTISFGGSISSQTVSLSGSGSAPVVTHSPTSLVFGVQNTGTTSAAQQVTVTNSGNGTLNISSVNTTSQFATTNACGAPIAPAGTCTIQVTFTPAASGVQMGTLTIADNASNSPQSVALSGNQPGGLSISGSNGSASTSATITSGQTATYSLSVSGTNGLSGAVNFTCSGAPSKSTCSVTPNPLNLGGQSAVAATVSVVTQANAMPLTQLYRPKSFDTNFYVVGMIIELALLICLAVAQPAGRFRNSYVGAMAIALLCAFCVACGGSSSSSPQPPAQNTTGTPSGQYTLTVTGTSGSVSQSVTLSLTVK
jgi:hypothetical protein